MELKKILYPHQLKAVYEMEQREKNNEIHTKNYYIYSNIGIYSDIPGYGKTMTIIALILRDQFKFDQDKPYIFENITQIYGNGTIIKKHISQYQRLNSTLIVTNQTLIRHWMNEISSSSLQMVVINNKRKCENVDPQLYDIVLCSSTMYNYFVSRFPNYAWKRFIFDEPTHTKIPAMRKIIAGFHWLITATPDMLLYTNNRNSYHYLGSLFGGYVDYNLFKHIIYKNDDEFVRLSVELPPIHHIYHQCFDTISSLLKNLIPDNINQMISAGNIEGAIKMLGGTETSSTNLIDLIRSEKLDSLKEADIKINRYERMEDHLRVAKWIEKKKNIEIHLLQLDQRLKKMMEYDQCHICFENKEHPVLLKCCYNLYCGDCILTWLKTNNTCPLCRKSINPSFMIYVQYNPDVSTNNDNQTLSIQRLTKNDTILKIYNSNPNGKIVIFSSFDETLYRLQETLDEVSILEIKGTIETRNKIIDTFRTCEQPQILFINSLENGAGLHLPEATDIILYHDMSENIQSQIIGRCQRIGRIQSLNVHHLKN